MPTEASALPELDPLFWRIVDEGLAASRLELVGPERAAVDGHARLLVAWNSAINLTSLRSPEQIARNHILDSLLALPALRALASDVGSLLDIGSGGGFPALPLVATLRPSRAALVESIGKKARFLAVAAAEVSAALSADAGRPVAELSVVAERAEDVADKPNQRESWQLVTARAVGTLAEVAELGLPLARHGGHVVAWKLDNGDGSLAREVEAARRISQACGGTAPRIVPIEHAAQVGLDGHCLVTIRKVRPTPAGYPRQPSERHRPR